MVLCLPRQLNYSTHDGTEHARQCGLHFEACTSRRKEHQMTKTEQLIFDRIKTANDSGDGANEYRIIDQTAGKYTSSGVRGAGYRTGQQPKKAQAAALERLIETGAVERHQFGLYIANHPALASVAAAIDLVSGARQIAKAQTELDMMVARFERDREFVSKWLKPVE